MKALNNVDTDRMRRVLDRLYPGKGTRPAPAVPGTAPPDRGETCALLERERRLGRKLQDAMSRSRECRHALGGAYTRCGKRAGELRSECFLRRSGRLPSPESGSRPNGVLSMLREAFHELERLGEGYEKAAAKDPRRQEMYQTFSADCRKDAMTVRKLIESVMR